MKYVSNIIECLNGWYRNKYKVRKMVKEELVKDQYDSKTIHHASMKLKVIYSSRYKFTFCEYCSQL